MSKSVSELILSHMSDSDQDECLNSLLHALKIGLESIGFEIHRIQIPFTKSCGFRHPTFWGIALTWDHVNQYNDSIIMLHEDQSQESPDKELTVERMIQDPLIEKRIGPYYKVLISESGFYREKLNQDALPYSIFEKLREQGYVDYCAFALTIPYAPVPQFMSISSRKPFPEDIEELILPHMSTLSLAVYGAYRTSQARKLAECYIGPKTGYRVMNGEITRHHTSMREVGIMFCDIRDFTRLSEELGSINIVPVMNDIFEIIGTAALAYGGEILKFIGDAVLLIFDQDKVPTKQTANDMVHSVEEAICLIKTYAHETSLPIAAGFGCHIGQVTYGNIGSKTRLDFTIMGPNVNLTSRLETLTKTVDVPALFTESIAQHVSKLLPCGSYSMKGISEPVKVWKLPTCEEPSC